MNVCSCYTIKSWLLMVWHPLGARASATTLEAHNNGHSFYHIRQITIGSDNELVCSGSTHHLHYSNVIMGTVASQITTVSIVYSTVCSGADQRKHQSSSSLAFVRVFTGEFPGKCFHLMTSSYNQNFLSLSRQPEADQRTLIRNSVIFMPTDVIENVLKIIISAICLRLNYSTHCMPLYHIGSLSKVAVKHICRYLLLTLIPAWISNHMPSKVWYEINFPAPPSMATPLTFGDEQLISSHTS